MKPWFPLAVAALAIAPSSAAFTQDGLATAPPARVIEGPCADAPSASVALFADTADDACWTIVSLDAQTTENAGDGVAAELLAAPDADPSESPAITYSHLWRLAFHDGAEARGLDILRDRLVPVMKAVGDDVFAVRMADGPWDVLVFDGGFATADAARARIDRRDAAFEEALVTRIGDPRVVAATRLELGALVAAEYHVVVARRLSER